MQRRRVIQNPCRGRINAALVHSKGVINDAPTNSHRVIQNPVGAAFMWPRRIQKASLMTPLRIPIAWFSIPVGAAFMRPWRMYRHTRVYTITAAKKRASLMTPLR